MHPLQINIEVGKIHGRIHITEVEDNPQDVGFYTMNQNFVKGLRKMN